MRAALQQSNTQPNPTKRQTNNLVLPHGSTKDVPSKHRPRQAHATPVRLEDVWLNLKLYNNNL